MHAFLRTSWSLLTKDPCTTIIRPGQRILERIFADWLKIEQGLYRYARNLDYWLYDNAASMLIPRGNRAKWSTPGFGKGGACIRESYISAVGDLLVFHISFHPDRWFTSFTASIIGCLSGLFEIIPMKLAMVALR